LLNPFADGFGHGARQAEEIGRHQDGATAFPIFQGESFGINVLFDFLEGFRPRRGVILTAARPAFHSVSAAWMESAATNENAKLPTMAFIK